MNQVDFDRRVIPEPNSGCWLWIGAACGHVPHEYGSVNLGHAIVKAHRLSYERHRGEIPAGMLVLHKCDVSLCVNPDHLFLGTHADNVHDMMRKGRANTARGIDRADAKLTDAKVREVRRLYAGGSRVMQLSRKYGIHPSVISRIISGETWKHVQMEDR